MRMTKLRAKIIDNLRIAGGGLGLDDLSEKIGRDKTATKRALRRLMKSKAVQMRDGAVTLLPAGYCAVGSFPPKR